MTRATLIRILAMGAITGKRSMAGAATLTRHGGVLKGATAVAALTLYARQDEGRLHGIR